MAKEPNDRIAYGKGAGRFFGDGGVIGSATQPLPTGREGGDDTLIGGATNAPQETIGDWIAIYGGTTSAFVGGNDYLEVRSATPFAIGDAFLAIANATGGDDRILNAGTASIAPVILTGDFFQVSTLAAGPLAGPLTILGGKDSIVGADTGARVENTVGDVVTVLGLNDVTGGDDILRGRGGINAVYGDVLEVRSNATIRGGNDRMSSGGGKDVVVGDVGLAPFGTVIGGSDTIDSGLGNDIVVGDLRNGASLTSSNVTIDLTGGKDTLSGGEGNDTMAGEFASGTVRNFNGADDLFFGNAGNDRMFGDARILRLDAAGAQGTGGNDAINGNGDDDYIVGDVGTLVAGSFKGGNDLLFGGLGNDTLIGDVAWVQPGATVIGGDDFLDGGMGDDVIAGGDGFDTGGFGADLFAVNVDLAAGTATGQGTDTLTSIENLQGSALGDTLRGAAGVNVIQGGDGGDLLDGRAGNDLLQGETGNDTLLGGDGGDFVSGGDGLDRLSGGAGADTLNGGGGADLFVMSFGSGADGIEDFTDGSDKIDVSGLGLTATQLGTQLTIVQFGTSTLVTLDSGLSSETSFELLNTTASTINLANDFVL